MTPDLFDRRRFLGAGTALTAGTLAGLALPRAAHADPLARPIARADTPDVSALIDEISAILNRPNGRWFHNPTTGQDFPTRCRCARCRAIQRIVWTCGVCGNSGPWIVAPCECREVRRDVIDRARDRIAGIEAGQVAALVAAVDDPAVVLRHERRVLAKYLALPDRMCTAHYDDEVRARSERSGASVPDCLHGNVTCPTCGASGAYGSPMDDHGDFTPLLHDIRVVLDRWQGTRYRGE